MVRLSTLAPCLFAIVLLGMHLGMRVLFGESLQVAWCPRGAKIQPTQFMAPSP